MYGTGFVCIAGMLAVYTNQIAVSGNQHKQYLNIMCSKYTLVVFNHRSSKSTANHSYAAMSFTDEAIQMAISRASSELGYV